MNEEPAGLASLLLDAGCTPRQSEILFLVADGLSYAEIAERLNISWAAVQTAAAKGRKRIMEYGAEMERAQARKEAVQEFFCANTS